MKILQNFALGFQKKSYFEITRDISHLWTYFYDTCQKELLLRATCEWVPLFNTTTFGKAVKIWHVSGRCLVQILAGTWNISGQPFPASREPYCSAQHRQWFHEKMWSKYTGCNMRNGPDFGRAFLRSNYTDITQNTYIQSSMVTEIMAGEVWNFDSCYSLIDYQTHIETGRNMWFL